jgi:hypothetical protein
MMHTKALEKGEQVKPKTRMERNNKDWAEIKEMETKRAM